MGSVTPLSATKKSLSSETQAFLFHRRTGPRTGRAGGTKKAGAAQPHGFSPVAGASPARGRGKSVRSMVNPPLSATKKSLSSQNSGFFVSPPDRAPHGTGGRNKKAGAAQPHGTETYCPARSETTFVTS